MLRISEPVIVSRLKKIFCVFLRETHRVSSTNGIKNFYLNFQIIYFWLVLPQSLIFLMNQFDFSLLEENEQLDVLFKDGVYIGKRKEADRSILLYQLEGFYVEVYYLKHRSCIVKLKCFRSTLFLDPYLVDFPVNHLIS
jgi:hypothetical protein